MLYFVNSNIIINIGVENCSANCHFTRLKHIIEKPSMKKATVKENRGATCSWRMIFALNCTHAVMF